MEVANNIMQAIVKKLGVKNPTDDLFLALTAFMAFGYFFGFVTGYFLMRIGMLEKEEREREKLTKKKDENAVKEKGENEDAKLNSNIEGDGSKTDENITESKEEKTEEELAERRKERKEKKKMKKEEEKQEKIKKEEEIQGGEWVRVMSKKKKPKKE